MATKKELTHERIVETAARAIRRAGYNGIGVADIMREAGLTHGGFYAHFPSREAMLAEAMERAAADRTAVLRERIQQRQAQGESALCALLEVYLSDAHLAAEEEGCPVAALGSEIARQSEAVRQVACARITAMVNLVRTCLPDTQEEGQARVLVSTLVGTLQLARAFSDPVEGRAFLASSRTALLALYDPERRMAG